MTVKDYADRVRQITGEVRSLNQRWAIEQRKDIKTILEMELAFLGIQKIEAINQYKLAVMFGS